MVKLTIKQGFNTIKMEFPTMRETTEVATTIKLHATETTKLIIEEEIVKGE